MATDSFLFDPVSLVLCKGGSPVESKRPNGRSDDFEKALPAIDFSARYLHERVHWIQHFSTFTGLLSLFRVEMQTSVTIELLSGFADEKVDILPLRTKFSGEKSVECWNGLELLDAALCGDRSRSHFEGNYGPEWTKRMLAAVQFFSRITYCLPETGFVWPTEEQMAAKRPLEVSKLSLVDDGSGFACGGATIAEVHAWSAQILKISNFVENTSDYTLEVEKMISARASSLRLSFYEHAGLASDWQSEVLCSQAAFYALNAPVALFFAPPSGKKDDFMQIAPIAHFLSLARKIRSAPLANEQDVPKEAEEFLKWSKKYLDRLIGFDLFECNLALLELFAKSASYIPASSEPPQELHLSDGLRLSFLGRWVTEMVKVARAEPMFVMCPGHLYELNRPRFQELFGDVGNFVERTEGVGYSPAPYFSRKMEAAEYVRQVAFAVQADVARAMMVKDRAGLNRLLTEYSNCHPDFRELHLVGVHTGLRSLNMPNALYREFRDHVPLPDTWQAHENA